MRQTKVQAKKLLKHGRNCVIFLSSSMTESYSYFGGIVMICSKCGQEVPDTNSFCTYCGASLTPQPAPASQMPFQGQPQPTPQYAPYPNTPPVMPMNNVMDPGASIGKTAFILGLVGVIAGAICSCGCGLLGGILPLIASILAIVFGNQAKQKSAEVGIENKQAKTAMILGIAGIAVIVIFIIILMIIGGAIGASSYFSQFSYGL